MYNKSEAIKRVEASIKKLELKKEKTIIQGYEDKVKLIEIDIKHYKILLEDLKK